MVAPRPDPYKDITTVGIKNDQIGAALFGTGEGTLVVNPNFGASICSAVDKIDALKGTGVILMAIGRDHELNVWGKAWEQALWAKAVLREPARRQMAKVVVAIGPPPSQPPTIPEPTATQRMLREAFSALFTCGGAACCWAGVLGSGFAAPESGGASLALSIYLGTAAITASVQCAESLARMAIALTEDGREKLKKMDESEVLKNINTAMDTYVLFGGVLFLRKTLLEFAEARSLGTDVPLILNGKITRDQARKFYENVVQNASREMTAVTNSLKEQMLDYVGLALGIAGSARDEAGAVYRINVELRKALRYDDKEKLQATVAIVQ